MYKRVLRCVIGLLLVLGSSALPAAVAAEPLASPAAAPDLRTTWFFAEGATAPPFHTWLLLFNPNAGPAAVTVTFFGSGVIGSRTATVAANSRLSLFVNDLLPNAAFGMRVDSSLPVAAERAMYFRQDGTAVAGVPAPSTTWLFAEGASAFPHQTWFLLLNPGSVTATVTFTFLLEPGGSQTTTLTVPPQSRASLFANSVLPSAAFSTRITSSQPIVAERSMFKADTGSGHAVAGAIEPARAWTFAEGSTFAPFDTWYLVLNPNSTAIRLNALLLTDTGPGATLELTVPPNSRRSIFVNQINPNVNFGAAFFIADGAPFVVERSMFFRRGSHGTLGATALSDTWYFAEGSTAPPFDTWILLANPNPQAPASATLTFFLPDGRTSSRTVTIPSQGRTSVFVNQFVPASAVAIRVVADGTIVAERSMYFSQGNGGHNTIGIPR